MKSGLFTYITIAILLLVETVSLTPPAQSQTFSILYTFTGGADGGFPVASLIRDPQGNLYGTTYAGGVSGAGTVFKLSRAGKETVLYSFTGGSDGLFPNSQVIQDSEGNLYGTTYEGGDFHLGTVFRLSRTGQVTVLQSFTGSSDGASPVAGLIRDPEGNLYGTASGGGLGNGTVFKLSKTGKFTVLYSFKGGSDGLLPMARLLRDSNGSLYGTTVLGGSYGYGTVFELGNAGKETVLYTFTGGSDGAEPSAGLIQDSKKNFYGTAFYGGAYGYGTVFKLSKAGEETVLYSFASGLDGANPDGELFRDSKGRFYGTTGAGGVAGSGYGYGTVYKLSEGRKETVLYRFSGKLDGDTPHGVVRDERGNLYGTTDHGGSSDWGTVFKVTP
jgi:uncharacterized repeat protein (TIGR03803 family)